MVKSHKKHRDSGTFIIHSARMFSNGFPSRNHPARKEMPMSIEKHRRHIIFEEIKHFFDTHTGFPQQWQKEIDELSPEDTMDALDVVIGLMCTPEWGGDQAASSFLSMLGLNSEEIDSLLADSLDYSF